MIPSHSSLRAGSRKGDRYIAIWEPQCHHRPFDTGKKSITWFLWQYDMHLINSKMNLSLQRTCPKLLIDCTEIVYADDYFVELQVFYLPTITICSWLSIFWILGCQEVWCSCRKSMRLAWKLKSLQRAPRTCLLWLTSCCGGTLCCTAQTSRSLSSRYSGWDPYTAKPQNHIPANLASLICALVSFWHAAYFCIQCMWDSMKQCLKHVVSTSRFQSPD